MTNRLSGDKRNATASQDTFRAQPHSASKPRSIPLLAYARRKLAGSNFSTMEERELKALQIAAKSKLTRRGKTWLVPSQSVRGAQYTVKLDPNEPECSCPD